MSQWVFTGVSDERLREGCSHVATLYERYSREAAISFCGGAAARSLCDNQWVVLRDVILCFATAGPASELSHFCSGSVFVWVADRPYHVA